MVSEDLYPLCGVSLLSAGKGMVWNEQGTPWGFWKWNRKFSIFASGKALLGRTSPQLLHRPLKRQASIHSAMIVSRELC
jgi:hypothetical protein